MTHTIEQFASECHKILKAENNSAGRSKVSKLLQDLLKDKAFVAKYIPDETPERKMLYEDPELKFCILAHHYRGAKTSSPHDHGPYWAIYGQATGETEMSDYKLLEPASAEKPGKV
jgi:predicted metal-dependent enzyme (double-stranded beta helix superfamily)